MEIGEGFFAIRGVFDNFRKAVSPWFCGGPSRTRTCDPLIMSEEDLNLSELAAKGYYFLLLHFTLCL
jgi:hypothetical protein